MEGGAFVELVEKCGHCAAWVDTWMAGALVFLDYSNFYVFLLFLGISFSTNDALLFLLNNSLMLQEYLVRYPLAWALGVYGPQGEDCEPYSYQLPCKWGQLLGMLTAFAVLLSLYRRRITGYWTFFFCAYVAFIITFAPLYRRIASAGQMAASVCVGYVLAPAFFFASVWILRRYGDALVDLPVVRWFGMENSLSVRPPCAGEKV